MSKYVGYGQLYVIRRSHESNGYLYIASSEDDAWAHHFDSMRPKVMIRAHWVIETADWTRGKVTEKR